MLNVKAVVYTLKEIFHYALNVSPSFMNNLNFILRASEQIGLISS